MGITTGCELEGPWTESKLDKGGQDISVRGRLTQGESLRGKFEKKPVIPSLLKSWGPKATSHYLYIRVVTTTRDDGNYQHMQTIHRTSKKVKEQLR